MARPLGSLFLLSSYLRVFGKREGEGRGFVARGGCYGNGSDLGVFLGLKGMARVSLPSLTTAAVCLATPPPSLQNFNFLAVEGLVGRFCASACLSPGQPLGVSPDAF